MVAKGVPQLLDSVLKLLLLERPDDAVGFMREVLRKSGGEAGAAGEVGAGSATREVSILLGVVEAGHHEKHRWVRWWRFLRCAARSFVLSED